MPDGRPHSRVEHVGGGSGHVYSGGPAGGGPIGGGPTGGGPRRGMSRGGGVGIIGTVLAIIVALFGGFVGVGNSTPDITPGSYTTYSNNASYSNTDERSVDTSVDPAARAKFTTLKGNGEDEVTLMLYLIGSDLESQSGMATKDLNEILHAGLTNDKLNVIIQTGGTKRWQNNVIGTNIERWKASSQGLQRLESQRTSSMAAPDALGSFIQFAAKTAPADRYMLILWDHGGGSVNGYGRDEFYPRDALSTSEVAKAMKAGGVKFDFVGFDACLMATLENAIALEPYADYYIASEESEPGTGWYYTNWLAALNENTSTPTLDLGKQILDDFTAKSPSVGGYSYGTATTLSIVDLAELSGTVPTALTDFGNDLQSTLTSDHYNDVATARSSAKEFSSSNRLDQVDVVDFCLKVGSDEAMTLANALKSAVKYNRVKGTSDSYGLSMYFPNRSYYYMNEMSNIYEDIGMDEAFTGSVKQYATLGSAGQITSNNNGGTSLFDVLTGGQYYNYGGGQQSPYSGQQAQYSGTYTANDLYNMLGSAMSGSSGYYTTGGAYYGGRDFQSILGGKPTWMSDEMLRVAAGTLSGRALSPDTSFETVRKDGHDVLALTNEQWAEITAAEVNVFVPDENNGGWLDLGLDNTGKYNEDGDLIDEWSGNWLTLDGHFAALYPISDLDEDGNGKYITTKYIPANLNGERVDILVEFNEETGNDTVLGARQHYANGTEEKGLIAVEPGDTIQLLCDHYTEDGKVKDEYKLGSAFTVGANGLKVYSLKVDNDGCVFTYRLTDLYGAFHWLPVKSH